MCFELSLFVTECDNATYESSLEWQSRVCNTAPFLSVFCIPMTVLPPSPPSHPSSQWVRAPMKSQQVLTH